MDPDTAFELRRRMLDFWLNAAGEEATLRMHERAECRGTIAAVDAAQSRLHVRQLQTPLGIYPCATVRSGDVLAVEFDQPWLVACPLPPVPSGVPGRSTDGAAAWTRTGAWAASVDVSTERGGARDASSTPLTTLAARKRALLEHVAAGVAVPAAGKRGASNRKTGTSRRAIEDAAADETGEAGGAEGGVEGGADGSEGAAGGAGGAAADEWDGRHRDTHKYWRQRFSLFSKFDRGVKLDREGWFSVTPAAESAGAASSPPRPAVAGSPRSERPALAPARQVAVDRSCFHIYSWDRSCLHMCAWDRSGFHMCAYMKAEAVHRDLTPTTSRSTPLHAPLHAPHVTSLAFRERACVAIDSPSSLSPQARGDRAPNRRSLPV